MSGSILKDGNKVRSLTERVSELDQNFINLMLIYVKMGE